MNEHLQRLVRSPLMLLFTPGLVPEVVAPPGEETECEIDAALFALESALAARVQGRPAIGSVQLRIKDTHGGSPAHTLYAWGIRVADLFAGLGEAPLLLVNDRVDVTRALGANVAGVHLGQGDLPIAAARAQLGDTALIGRSTHNFAELLVATEEGANYLGFGPIHATTTKGFARGIGAEQAWIATNATSLALFPIGGIDASNAGELNQIGHAAVSSAILGAEEPAAAATAIAAALTLNE